ncbi:MAG TPA: hypothetical protein VM656_08275 [Pyrinomonadaceae bacterium]|jgi:hypothetical protein|nr:hypothetical protein [Pyrinomonadaceae bacterium]
MNADQIRVHLRNLRLDSFMLFFETIPLLNAPWHTRRTTIDIIAATKAGAVCLWF